MFKITSPIFIICSLRWMGASICRLSSKKKFENVCMYMFKFSGQIRSGQILKSLGLFFFVFYAWNMKIKFTYVSFAYIKFTYDEVCLQTLFSYHFHVVTHFTMFDLTRCVNKRGSISVFVQFSRLQAPKFSIKERGSQTQ